MDEVLKNLSSVSWWVGVVLVGLAINLIAAYLKPRLDGTLSSVSKRWATKSAVRRGEREARIRALIASEHEQLLNRTEELRLRVRSFGYCFQAIVLMLAALWLILGDSWGTSWGTLLTSVTRFFECCRTGRRKLLGLNPALPEIPKRSAHDLLLELTGIDLSRCPSCKHGTMIVVAELPPTSSSSRWDSS
jgi:hypothetical protein